MSIQNITSPCELDCNSCINKSKECQAIKEFVFSGYCEIFQCIKTKDVEFCDECLNFPCNLLHPMSDRSNIFPRNLKVFTLSANKSICLKQWEEIK